MLDLFDWQKVFYVARDISKVFYETRDFLLTTCKNLAMEMFSTQ